MEILWKIIQWIFPRQKKPNYTIIDMGNDLHFRINDGHYKDTVIKYSNVQILEDTGFAKLKFNYHLVRSDTFTEEDLQNDSKFVTIIGDILQHYILYKAKQVETTRSSNTKEFGL